ncbi:MAG: hypothetical protein IKL22_13545 [Lachnospiraceae bacterium]|nr:hypothetical protein [Lachnospiraceae bacterium]
MKRMKRLIPSLLLTLALLLTMSTPVHAGEGAKTDVIDAAVVFADFHVNQPPANASEQQLNEAYKTDFLRSVMTGIKNSGLPISTVTSSGDAFSVCEDSGDKPKYFCETAPITDTIQSVFGNIPVNYVWSDHDRYSDKFNTRDQNGNIHPIVTTEDKKNIEGGKTSGFVYGLDGKSNYYIYNLSMADLSTDDRYSSGFNSDEAVTATIKAFETQAAKLDPSKPLFIMSHQPLFDRRNDNGHALEWCDAINSVAENMDVAFFFGHNHNHDEVGDYTYQKGSTMPVACNPHMVNGKPECDSTNVKLNFTHLCAGYLNPGSHTAKKNTRIDTAMVITIYPDRINYSTYNKDGIYKDGFRVDLDVYRQAVPHVRRIELADHRDHYIAASGALNDYTGYHVNLPSDGKARTANISLPRPRPNSTLILGVYQLSEDGKKLTKIAATPNEDNTTLSFTTSSSGIYFIGTDLNPGATAGTTFNAGSLPTNTGTVYQKADSFENGGKYLLIGELGRYGEPIAYVNNNGNEGTENVSVNYSQIYLNNPNAVWTATGDDQNGYKLSNNGRYIGGETGNTVKGSSSEAAYLFYNAADVRLHTNSSTIKYLYYSTSGTEQWKFIDSKYSETSSRQMWIYREVPVCSHHAFACATTQPTSDSVGWTKRTCAICGYSDTAGNFTAPGSSNPEATIKITAMKEITTGSITQESTSSSSSTTSSNKTPANPTPNAPVVYEEKTIYVPVDNFENSGKYLLIGEETIGGAPLAHLNNNGDEGAQKVTINTTPLVTDTTTYQNGYIELSNANAVWTASGDTKNGFILSNNGKYIGTKSDNAGDTIRSSSSNAAKVIYDASADRLKTVSGTTKYLYYTTYSGEYWKWATSANSSTSSRNMQIFKEVTVKVAK